MVSFCPVKIVGKRAKSSPGSPMASLWWKPPSFLVELCMSALRKLAFVSLTCTFALCGSVIGSISGALKGLTTETGLFGGAGIGVVAGALVSVEILESCLQGELLSKVAIFNSLLDGKVFPEWVSPAMLKAYQWQMNTDEHSSTEISDIYCSPSTRGLLPEIVRMIPELKISCHESRYLYKKMISCVVCLQDFKNGEAARRLPNCRHIFHTACIDKWLLRHGACPICRQEVKLT